MAKVIIAAIMNSHTNKNNTVVDDSTVVESIDEMNTFISDNQDETYKISFEFYLTTNPSVNYNSTEVEKYDATYDSERISYQTALLVLGNKDL
jgi:hypothetical protein